MNYLPKDGYSNGGIMSFEQMLILELIVTVKWLVVGGLLITFYINRVEDKKARIKRKEIELLFTLINESFSSFVDYLIKELETKKPQE